MDELNARIDADEGSGGAPDIQPDAYIEEEIELIDSAERTHRLFCWIL